MVAVLIPIVVEGALELVALSRAWGATHLLLDGSSAWWLQRYKELAEHLARNGRVVATNEAGVVWALRPAPPPGPPKLFCIGLTKTGTSSLHSRWSRLRVPQSFWRPGGR